MKVDNQTILMGKKKANKTDSLFHHHHQSHWPRPTSGNWNELCHWTRPQDTTLFTLFMGHRDDSSGGLRWYSILIIALGCQVLQMTEARHHHHHCRQHWKTWTSNKVPKRFWSNPVRPGPVLANLRVDLLCVHTDCGWVPLDASLPLLHRALSMIIYHPAIARLDHISTGRDWSAARAALLANARTFSAHFFVHFYDRSSIDTSCMHSFARP